MNSAVLRLGVHNLAPCIRHFSVTLARSDSYSCKLLIIGGGSAGCAMAAKFTRHLGPQQVVILEPSDIHYYQPLWTLVGAGASHFESTKRPMAQVLPSKAIWMKDAAAAVMPECNYVQTAVGHEITYEYIIIAAGMETDYEKVPGLTEALADPCSGVSTIYSPAYCQNTWRHLQCFKGGNAIFTYPNTPIKCPGAPQKIAYLADSYFSKMKMRSRANIMYTTPGGVIFGVPKYAEILAKVAQRKGICVNLKTSLVEVRPRQKEAVFKNKKCPEDELVYPYEILHVGPPMKPPCFIAVNEELRDSHGYLNVDKHTLQHVKYKNVFGLGDCTNTPNSKTIAAIAKQTFVVENNLLRAMENKPMTHRYDGYGACPLVTSYSKCILAEFLYGGVVHETLPINQARESRLAFLMKKYLFPYLYWAHFLKGRYHGPEWIRRIFHPFSKSK